MIRATRKIKITTKIVLTGGISPLLGLDDSSSSRNIIEQVIRSITWVQDQGTCSHGQQNDHSVRRRVSNTRNSILAILKHQGISESPKLNCFLSHVV